MSDERVRSLTAEELALVCGGSSLDTVEVQPDDPYYWYPDWPDNSPPDFYDPWDAFSSDNGGGGGSGYEPTLAEMRSYLQTNSEFNELSNKLKTLILQNDKLSNAVHDLLKQGITFGSTTGTSYFDGVTISVNEGARAGGNPSDGVLNMFFHEIGHFVNGIPHSQNYTNPNSYAQARAEAEVRADMFMVDVSRELGLTYYFTGTITAGSANAIANGTYSAADFQADVAANLRSNSGLGAAAAGVTVTDLNVDGRLDNLDLYLGQWVSPSGGSYSQWVQSNGGNGGSGGSGDGGGGTGGGDDPFNWQQN